MLTACRLRLPKCSRWSCALAATTVLRLFVPLLLLSLPVLPLFVPLLLLSLPVLPIFVLSTCISIIRAKALIAITRALSVALVKSAEVMTVMYVLIV